MPTQTPGRVGNNEQTGQMPSKEAEYSTLPYVVWRAKRRAEAAVREWPGGCGGRKRAKAYEGRCALEKAF